MKQTSCLGFIASRLLFALMIPAVVFCIAFGPRSIVFGFMFGAALMIALAWFGFRNPGLLGVADTRSVESRAAGAIASLAFEASDDPRKTAFGIGRFLGWCLTIFFGGTTCLFALFAIALRLRGELTTGMTGAAALCGASSVLTYIVWKCIARAGRP